MIYANSLGYSRSKAWPAGEACCPHCGASVIARCGEIKAWHWAHKSGSDCDSWSEGETVWHLGWKARVEPQHCEVIMGPHRADIVGNGGKIIELQHSPISTEEIREREAFYPFMIWLFDASTFEQNVDLRRKGDIYTFRWKWPHPSQCYILRPLFWHLSNDQILLVKKIHRSLPCGGWGKIISLKQFCSYYLSDVLKDDHATNSI